MSDIKHISNEDLHAYVDGELSSERMTLLSERIRADKTLEERVEAFKADKQRISDLYGSSLDSDIPSEWIQDITRVSLTSAPSRRMYIAAAIAASVVIAVLGWSSLFIAPLSTGNDVVERALDAWQRPFASAEIVDLDRASEMLSASVGLEMRAPDLSRMNFSLTGVEVPKGAASGEGITLYYMNPSQRRFAIFIRPSGGDVRFEMSKQGEVRICVWQDDVVGAVMLGELSAAEMLRLASLAYTGFRS